MKVKESTLNVCLICMGVLGLLVLLLPWYELSSHSYLSGYGSSNMSAGNQIGLFAANVSYFGYGLYILPAAAIGMGLGLIAKQFPLRSKAGCLLLIGALEALCLVLVNLEMVNMGTSASGYGYSVSAGFSTLIGYWIAMGGYAVTAVVGLVLFPMTPKPDPSEFNFK